MPIHFDVGHQLHPYGARGLNYFAHDLDDDSTPKYYGFVALNHSWIIYKEVVDSGDTSFRFASGLKDYSTNWTNRAALSYDYIYNLGV